MTFNGICAWCPLPWHVDIYLKILTLYFLALKEVGCGSVPQRCWNREIEANELSQWALLQWILFFLNSHWNTLLHFGAGPIWAEYFCIFPLSLNIALKLIRYSQQSVLKVLFLSIHFRWFLHFFITLFIEGGFFDWSTLEMTKCQPLK